jgi:ADP-ribosylglycohydrolase
MLGEPDRHRFVFGRGMVSDDTEHTCLIAQSLIAASNDEHEFARQFARRLRYWLLGVPAGIGLATLRATIKLWLGARPDRSGVFSAGNGPAMRSAILGVAFDDLTKLRRFVRASTRITHTDPLAEFGALAVALAAHVSCRCQHVTGAAYLNELERLLTGEQADKMLTAVRRAVESAACHTTTTDFALELGLSRGVTGYVLHTVPVALHSWLSHPDDFWQAVTSVIRCGGDTDTTGAIVGALVGCRVGMEGIPTEWLHRMSDWPRTTGWMQRLANQLATVRNQQLSAKPLRLPMIGVVARNTLFLAIVLFHGFRRSLPPY